MLQCTRCFGPRDRDKPCFAERFTDSKWCSGCYKEWLLKSEEQTYQDMFGLGSDEALSTHPTGPPQSLLRPVSLRAAR